MLVVCFMQYWKSCQAKNQYHQSVMHKMKWETQDDKEVRVQLVSIMYAKCRKLPNVSEDIEMKCFLVRSVIISSAAKCCGRKRLRLAASDQTRSS